MGGASPQTDERSDKPGAGEDDVGGGNDAPAGPAEAALRDHLGTFGFIVAPFLDGNPPGRRELVATAVLGKFGPCGTQRHFWSAGRGATADEEPAVLATALLNYATDPPKGHKAPPPYIARLFEEYLRRARDTDPVSRRQYLAAVAVPPTSAAGSGGVRPVTTRLEVPAAVAPWATRVHVALLSAMERSEKIRAEAAVSEAGIRQAWATDQRWARWGTDFQNDVVWLRVLGKYGESVGDPPPGPLPP